MVGEYWLSSTGWFLLRISLHTNIQNGSPFWSGSMLLDDQKLSSVQFSSAIPWTAARQASLSTISEFAQTYVLWVSDAIQASHPLLPPCPLALSLSQLQGLFQWVCSWHQGPKDWSFSFSISPSSEYSDWFPLGWTGLISLKSKGLSRVSPTPQFKSINSSALSFPCGPTLTSVHDWKKT